MQRFTGKVAVVTGASRGIGFGTARRLAAEGAHVVLVARTTGPLDEARKAITGAGGTATVARADVTDAGELAAVRAHAEAAAGPVDVLAAFAGGGGEPTPLDRLPPERWHQVVNANLTSTYLTVACFLPSMLERGAGAILTMSSTAGRGPTEANAAYAAANGGILAFTRQAAMQAAPQGVRVNSLVPGSIMNDRLASMPPEVHEKIAALHPLGRIGTSEDVAAAAAFLLSDEASWITGAALDITGGRVMS